MYKSEYMSILVTLYCGYVTNILDKQLTVTDKQFDFFTKHILNILTKINKTNNDERMSYKPKSVKHLLKRLL